MKSLELDPPSDYQDGIMFCFDILDQKYTRLFKVMRYTQFVGIELLNIDLSKSVG